MTAEDGSAGRLRGAIDHDAVLVLAVMLGIYLVFAVAGALLGFDVNGVANVLRRVTFLTAVYALLTLGLNLQWGYTGLFNIGVAGFMAVGVYVTAILTRPVVRVGEDVPIGFGVPGFDLPLAVAVVAGVVAAALAGALVALPALRLRSDYLAIATIGLAETVRLSLQSETFGDVALFGYRFGTGGGRGIATPTNPVRGLFFSEPATASAPTALGRAVFGATRSIGLEPNVVVGWAYALVLLAVVAAAYWLLARMARSPFGRVLKAIREDERVAQALGKPTPRFKLVAFAVGCGLMGLAGILWRGSQGTVYPDVFVPEFTFFVWIALIVGGASSNTGSVLGAAAFAGLLWEGPRYANDLANRALDVGATPDTFLEALGPLAALDPGPLATYVLAELSGSLRIVLVGVLLILLMQRRPEGLLGWRTESAAAVDLDRDAGEVER